ncbi:MAG: hypothetical protein LBC88_05325, partial [Spirochaetaceae bacterium]|nr:hypothetical protein [Spirochaetaceae bacterium]
MMKNNESAEIAEVLEDTLAACDPGEIPELPGAGEEEAVMTRRGPTSGTIAAFVPFKASVFPAMVIDRDLYILAANESCRNLFTGFSVLEGKAFFEVFGKYFTMDD